MLDAAMGSRGNPFVTARGVLSPSIANLLGNISSSYPEFIWSDSTPTGSGYWSDNWSAPSHASQLGTKAAWGDDHGSLGLTAISGACSVTAPTESVKAHVKSTQITETTDQHQWLPIAGNDTTPPEVWHTMGDCRPYCPSVWVSSVGWKMDLNDPDSFGQPKATVLLERDTTVLPRPWELNFRFHFARTGPAERFDNRGYQLRSAFAGTDIHLAYAFATGVAYYHRKDHWVETPNLLNPYWRATLISSDFDKEGNPRQNPADPERMLPNWRQQAYRDLVAAGFKGFQ
jgi:hypothetical protein